MNWVHAEGQFPFYPPVPLDSSCATMPRSPQIQFPRYSGQPGTHCVVNGVREHQCVLTWVSVRQPSMQGNWLNDTQRTGMGNFLKKKQTITLFLSCHYENWKDRWSLLYTDKKRMTLICRAVAKTFFGNPNGQRRCENAAEEVDPDMEKKRNKACLGQGVCFPRHAVVLKAVWDLNIKNFPHNERICKSCEVDWGTLSLQFYWRPNFCLSRVNRVNKLLSASSNVCMKSD